MKATIIAATLTAVVVPASLAQAQGYAVRENSYNYRAPVVYRHSSTYEEGVLRGAADYIRGVGDYNYQSSLAAINYEEARRRYMQNRVQYVKDYFERRRINREAREYERGPRLTAEQLKAIARQARPQPLAAHQFDPATKSVLWPAALQGEEFAAARNAVDAAIKKWRGANAGAGGVVHRTVKAAVAEMRGTLKTKIRSMGPAEYMAAKKFLRSLEYDASQIPSVSGIVSR